MRQKYVIEKINDTNKLVIKEFGELESGTFSLTCEESYNAEGIAAALDKGKAYLISALRTQNFFPTSFFVTQLAEAVEGVFLSESSAGPVELILNDADLIQEKMEAEEVEVEEIVEEEDSSIGLNELLDDDLDGNSSVDVSSIKVADDEASFDTD